MIPKILNIVPHRYPFLLVDKILEVVEGKRAVGVKNVTINEPYFIGHFPDYPVIPGVLIVESLAQVGGIVMSNGESNINKIGLLTGIDNCRFKKQVKPGHQLYLEFEVTRIKGQIVKGKGGVGNKLKERILWSYKRVQCSGTGNISSINAAVELAAAVFVEGQNRLNNGATLQYNHRNKFRPYQVI